MLIRFRRDGLVERACVIPVVDAITHLLEPPISSFAGEIARLRFQPFDMSRSRPRDRGLTEQVSVGEEGVGKARRSRVSLNR